MKKRLLKIFGIIFVLLLGISTLLYMFAPYVIKNRFGSNEAEAAAEDKNKHYFKAEALPKNGRILFVAAHPDDLEFMAGGTLPQLLKRGNQVYLVILTNGGKQRYMPGFYSRAIIKTRREDQIKIAKAEGLKKVIFGDYRDGYLKYSDEAFSKVQKIAHDYGITDIFTFESGKRDGYYDTDHDVAGRIGTAVAKTGDNLVKGLYYFRASDPNMIIDITDTFQKKLDIMFMFTEFRYKHRMMIAMHEAWAGVDGARIEVKYGEAFSFTELKKKPNGAQGVVPGRAIDSASGVSKSY